MKVISIRKGFAADHSSTSYEFYAIDKILGSKEKAAVSRLSSRANPTERRASFIYHGEWADLPGGWEPLMEKYYDVMWSESYGWWNLVMAWNTDTATIQKMAQFDFTGGDDVGINIYHRNNRLIISIDCRLDALITEDKNSYDEYSDYDDDDYGEADNSIDNLLRLLEKNREYLMKGDYRLLKGIIDLYAMEETLVNLPEGSAENSELPEEIQELLSCIEI
ncbi:MAG: hypothetical protein AMS26_02175 [Bacteroides sp. SM23_62]|nr:MAG: hypothetical protein AMS26_02175 [Bacteroides sp. SM23_62]